MKKWYNNTKFSQYFEEGSQPVGWVLGRIKTDYKNALNTEEVKAYYTNHSTVNTANHFYCSVTLLKKFLKLNNIAAHSEHENKHFGARQKLDTDVANGLLNNYTAFDFDKVKSLLEAGVENKEVCKILGMSKSILHKLCLVNNYRKPKAACHNAAHDNFLQLQKRIPRELILQKYEKENLSIEECAKALNISFSQLINLLKAYNIHKSVEKHNEKIRMAKKGTCGNGKYTYNDEYFDSFPELCFYLYNIKQGNNIIRKVAAIIYEFEGKKHHYIPDFEIDGQLYEIKGGQFLNEDGTWQNPFDHSLDSFVKAKYDCAVANNVIILYPKDYKYYEKWFKDNNFKKEDFLSNNINKEGN